MTSSRDRLAQGFLRYASPLHSLRRLPVLGNCLRWLGERIVPRETRTWVQVENGAATGIWLHLNPRTGLDSLRGAGEPEVQEFLRSHLRSGMTFYDLGANIGFFSLMAARLVGEQGRVVAFEADPDTAARLREHVARNKFYWVTVEEKAVWSEASTVLFERVDPATSPDRGLGHVADAASASTIEIEAVTLDDFARTSSTVPDFIKCDVEGAEVEVFRGAQRLLKENRPGILCEIHSEENRRVLLDEFARLRYACKDCGERHLVAVPR